MAHFETAGLRQNLCLAISDSRRSALAREAEMSSGVLAWPRGLYRG